MKCDFSSLLMEYCDEIQWNNPVRVKTNKNLIKSIGFMFSLYFGRKSSTPHLGASYFDFCLVIKNYLVKFKIERDGSKTNNKAKKSERSHVSCHSFSETMQIC